MSKDLHAAALTVAAQITDLSDAETAGAKARLIALQAAQLVFQFEDALDKLQERRTEKSPTAEMVS